MLKQIFSLYLSYSALLVVFGLFQIWGVPQSLSSLTCDKCQFLGVSLLVLVS